MNAAVEGTNGIRHAVERIVGQAVDRLTVAGAGANSALYCAEMGRSRYAVKTYLPHIKDGRARVEREWRAINFLHSRGALSVPQPVGHDDIACVLVMEWIEGVPVGRVSDADMDAAIGFIRDVFALSAAEGAAAFGLAAEACLSTAEIVGQIVRRRDGFVSLPELDRFLGEVFDPLCSQVTAAARSYDVVPIGCRRLVPSDFGFHNALRAPNGSLRFFDLDYFGWDDPVKLTADFVLHPAMALTSEQKAAFVGAAAGMLSDDAAFSARLQNNLPLFALRWALIVLNAFRRDRRATGAVPSVDVLAAQLRKARDLCDVAKNAAYGSNEAGTHFGVGASNAVR